MPKKKRKFDWKVAFKQLLAPKLIRALKDHASGATPMRPGPRQACRRMLRLVMTETEVRTALAPARRRRNRTAKRRRS